MVPTSWLVTFLPKEAICFSIIELISSARSFIAFLSLQDGFANLIELVAQAAVPHRAAHAGDGTAQDGGIHRHVQRHGLAGECLQILLELLLLVRHQWR